MRKFMKKNIRKIKHQIEINEKKFENLKFGIEFPFEFWSNIFQLRIFSLKLIHL